MPISNKLPEGLSEVDVIIAGGGTVACLIAGRLAAAHPELSILVIEGGQDNYENENVVNPGLFREHLRPGSTTGLFYKAKAEKQLADKERIVPAGGLLGGGSSVNLMLYTRAQRSDFDSWNTPGWSADELIPFLKKFETYHGCGDEKTHGYSGPVHVSDGGYKCPRSESDFIDACTEVGYPEYKDMQDLDNNNGTERWMRYVSLEGRRQDTAHCFLHPRLRDGKHPNLHVLCEHKVVRILFDENKRASAVEFTPNPDYHDASVVGTKSSIKARRLVVVGCGAIGTPAVLERSGLGSKSILEKAGVSVVEDLPGVGNDYQDHNLVFYPFRTNLEPHETMDEVLRVKEKRDEAILNKLPILRWNTCDVSSKIRPTEEEVAELGVEFQKAWNRDFRDNPNRPLMLMSLVSSYLEDPTKVPPGQYVSVAMFTAYPYSRGQTHITGPEWTDPLDFSLGFFTDPHDIDLKKQIWAYKKHREVMRRTNMYRGELEIGHPKFSPDSPAACVSLDYSPPERNKTVENLVYSEDDDRAIEQFLRENIQTTWHQLGTAKMAPREQKGVVDKDLNVYGVQGLKVADLSIAPENVAANTMNTALLIGEKAADIIVKELGLGGARKTTQVNGHRTNGIGGLKPAGVNGVNGVH